MDHFQGQSWKKQHPTVYRNVLLVDTVHFWDIVIIFSQFLYLGTLFWPCSTPQWESKRESQQLHLHLGSPTPGPQTGTGTLPVSNQVAQYRWVAGKWVKLKPFSLPLIHGKNCFSWNHSLVHKDWGPLVYSISQTPPFLFFLFNEWTGWLTRA